MRPAGPIMRAWDWGRSSSVCASEPGKHECGGFVCLAAWSAALRVSHIGKAVWSQESILTTIIESAGQETGASCMFGGSFVVCIVSSPVLRAYRKVQSVGMSCMLPPKAGASTLRLLESV